MKNKKIGIQLKNNRVTFRGFRDISEGTVIVYHLANIFGSEKTTSKQIKINIEDGACDDVRLAEIVAEYTKAGETLSFEKIVPDADFPECVYYLQNEGEGGFIIYHTSHQEIYGTGGVGLGG